MTLEHATEFRLYYDSTAEDPREDPEAVRRRTADLADERGIDYEEVDVADLPDEEVESIHARIVDEIHENREYVVDNRVMTPEVFATRRPTLVIEYADETPTHVYPHRDDDVSMIPIGVTDFLDEVRADRETDRGDYGTLLGTGSDGAAADDGAAGETDESETQPLLGGLGRYVAKVVPSA